MSRPNAFRIRAYRNAARVVHGLGSEVSAMLERGADLAELPGIGHDLAGKIKELAATAHVPMLDELHRHLPAIALELLRLPGLGPKRVKMLCGTLDIHSMEQLHRALLDGRVRGLPCFGSAIEKKLLQAIENRPKGRARFKLAAVEGLAVPLVEYMKKAPGLEQVAVAGSYRRCQETVGDIDIVAAAPNGPPVVEWFAKYPENARVTAMGPTRATVMLRSGLQVDLHVVASSSYGAALRSRPLSDRRRSFAAGQGEPRRAGHRSDPSGSGGAIANRVFVHAELRRDGFAGQSVRTSQNDPASLGQ